MAEVSLGARAASSEAVGKIAGGCELRAWSCERAGFESFSSRLKRHNSRSFSQSSVHLQDEACAQPRSSKLAALLPIIHIQNRVLTSPRAPATLKHECKCIPQ